MDVLFAGMGMPGYEKAGFRTTDAFIHMKDPFSHPTYLHVWRSDVP